MLGSCFRTLVVILCQISVENEFLPRDGNVTQRFSALAKLDLPKYSHARLVLNRCDGHVTLEAEPRQTARPTLKIVYSTVTVPAAAIQ